MILVIDVGNTNIVFALMKGEKVVHSWRVKTSKAVSVNSFQQGFAEAKVEARQIAGGILASVVPDLVQGLRQHFNSLTWKDLLVIGDPGVDIGIEIQVDNPEEVGADRLVNAIAGAHYFGSPLIIIDFGTATTFDVLGPKGEYLGGAISTGIGLSLKCLHEATAKLPLIDIEAPADRRVTGKSTRAAMQSGLYYGYLSLVEGMIKRLKAEHGKAVKTVATGGFSTLLASKTKAIDHHMPDLTLQGLRLIYERTSND